MPEARTCQIRSWDTAGRVNAATTKTVPRNSGSFGPNLRFRMPARGAEDDHHDDGRQQEQAGLRHGLPEAVPGGLGQQEQGRDQQERAEHGEAEYQGDQVGCPHAADLHQLHVDERFLDPQLDEYERDQADDAEGEQADGLDLAPAPGLALADGQQQRDERHRQDGGAEHVEPAGGADRGLLHAEDRAEQRDGDEDQRQPEQPVPREVLDDRAGGHDADAGADAEDRRDQADDGRDLLAGQLVADHADRQRQDRARRALEHAVGDQHGQVRGQRGDERPGGEGGQHADEDLALALAMSPSRPRMGVRTDADSRYAVTIQLTSLVEAFSSRPIVESAGETSDWSTANARPPSARYSTNSPPPVLPPSAGADPAEVVSSMV
nr:hypothetical protein GCM10020092_069500 [Actinoplanes digitatis]